MNHTHLKDHELLAQSVSEPKLFEVLVERYQPLFFAKARKIVGSREEAEDIVQETFVKIYIHSGSFKVRQGATFSSWAYRILINTSFTYCKKRGKERALVEKLLPEELAELGSVAEESYEMSAFISLVSKIPIVLRRVLTLSIFEGKTAKDIAEVEGISEGAVRIRLHRAKKEFKKLLKTYAV